MRWGSAAEKQCIDFMWLAELLQFTLERFQVCIDQVVSTRDQREVAIAAAMAAEGDVDIRCAGAADAVTRLRIGTEGRRDGETEGI
jgi:hypothetical protein